MKKFFFYSIIFYALILVFHNASVFAQSEYQLLQPLPLGGGGSSGSANASQYISGMFNLIIGLAGALAVVRIIIGGLQYMSTDAIGGKSEAKETIQNAIWGLLLALGAWLILYTINPNLVKIELNIERVSSEQGVEGVGGRVLTGYSLTPEQVAEDSRIRLALSENQPPVLVNNPPCTTGGTTGCTNVVELPQGAIDSITNLASACDCGALHITGGTEGGHAEHGQDLGVLDLRATTSLNNYLTKTDNPQNGTVATIGSATYTYEAAGAGRSTGDHWHVNL